MVIGGTPVAVRDFDGLKDLFSTDWGKNRSPYNTSLFTDTSRCVSLYFHRVLNEWLL
jgi:hypothetical protein